MRFKHLLLIGPLLIGLYASPSWSAEKQSFWKTREQVMNNPHVFTARIGTFYNRIDGKEADNSSDGYFLSHPSYVIALDWEFQQNSGWSTLMSTGWKVYRYKQSIDPALFSKDYTFWQFEYWLGMGKRLNLAKPMMVKLYVGTYKDLYYFAPTFNSLAFESDYLLAIKAQLDWTAIQWKKKEVGVEVFAQAMRRGAFLRGGSEFGARILFSSYPVRVKYEFSASFLKTGSLNYRMLEGAILFEYLFSL